MRLLPQGLLIMLLGAALLGAAAAAAPTPLQLTSGSLSLSLDPSSLAYTVGVSGTPWFDSGGCDGGYSFSAEGTTASLAKGDLKALGPPVRGSGSDAAGSFTSLEIPFGRSGGEGAAAEWIATFKAYEGRSAIVFAQRWPKGVARALGGSTFPSLRATPTAPQQLGTLEYMGASW